MTHTDHKADPNEPAIDVRFVLRRLWYNARMEARYGTPTPPDFTAQYQDAQERWERRQDEMRSGIVSLAEYRSRKEVR